MRDLIERLEGQYGQDKLAESIRAGSMSGSALGYTASVADEVVEKLHRKLKRLYKENGKSLSAASRKDVDRALDAMAVLRAHLKKAEASFYALEASGSIPKGGGIGKQDVARMKKAFEAELRKMKKMDLKRDDIVTIEWIRDEFLSELRSGKGPSSALKSSMKSPDTFVRDFIPSEAWYWTFPEVEPLPNAKRFKG